MAIDCTIPPYLDSVSCFLAPCISEEHRIAARIYFLRLAAIALGEDEDEMDALISNSNGVPVEITDQMISAAYVYLYMQLAEELGAEIPDAEEMAHIVACAPCSPAGLAAELALLCRVFSALEANQGGIR